MKTNFLFPNYFKRIGWILLIPAAIMGFMVLFHDFEFSFLDAKVLSLFPDKFNTAQGISSFQQSIWWRIENNNLTDELSAVLFIVAALLIAFSKEKNEDEYIAKIRLESLMWATYINYAILIFCFLFTYGFTFLYILILNISSMLIVFILRFNFLLLKSKLHNYEK